MVAQNFNSALSVPKIDFRTKILYFWTKICWHKWKLLPAG